MTQQLHAVLLDHGFLSADAEKRHGTTIRALSSGESPRVGNDDVEVYLRSLVWTDGTVAGIGRIVAERRRILFFASSDEARLIRGLASLSVTISATDGVYIAIAEQTSKNARALHELFPWTKPMSLRTRQTTIGMGDRLGIATAGHIRAARRYTVSPVLAQQSVRENDFIGRTFGDVVANATWGVFQEGFRDGYGADGDHLKNIESIDIALGAAMPMVTLDLTEVMRPEVADWDNDAIANGFAELTAEFRDRVATDYMDQTIDVSTDEGSIALRLDSIEAQRCAVMYGPALDFSARVDAHLRAATAGAYDLEISIDETSTPTLPEHHLFIARELQHRGVTVNSLAPRFIGDFQKAVDYIGDIDEFERQFRTHCAIARAYGEYKISVHSGSDKFSVYPIVGRETNQRLHLKTSGTSWLEALATVARHDPALYRRIHEFAVEYYPTALTYYHITADFAAIAALEEIADDGLPNLLQDPNARQMLHISYGGILQNHTLARALYDSLFDLEEEYAEALRIHFDRHISPIGVAER